MRISDWSSDVCSSDLRQDGSGSAAQYVNMSRTTDLFIRCDKSLRRIQIARAGSVSANGAQMIVRTSFGDALWPARNVTGSPAYVAADVDPRDPWLEKIEIGRASCRERVGRYG